MKWAQEGCWRRRGCRKEEALGLVEIGKRRVSARVSVRVSVRRKNIHICGCDKMFVF